MLIMILFLPLISFVVSLLFGRFVGQRGACIISSSLIGISCFISWLVFVKFFLLGQEEWVSAWFWLDLKELGVGINLVGDKLSYSMLTIVTLVSFLVHTYSSSYMWGDPHLPRFMSYLSLFTFFMVLLVESENILLMFVGWEGVGLCSYLLINFWFTRLLANTSAIKAMVVNRIGDFGLVLAMALMWKMTGSLNWSSYSICGEYPPILVNILGLLLLLGAMGKSAQIGLHTWLPDAMEGPTPVSALIHAATMVTAGVFLIIRSAPIFEASSTTLWITLLVGAITALFAATTGLFQTDIKKIIAYSTTSQLGYMVASCGLSQFNLSLSHLINHAYFKALLFLSAGALIHANIDQQDIRKLGALWNQTPISYIGITIGSISLMGFPFLTGFYSKDLIIEWSSQIKSFSISVLLISGASLTAAYSTKILLWSYINPPSNNRIQTPTSDSNLWSSLVPLIILSVGSILGGFVLQDWINSPTPHPLVNSWVKMFPLVFSIAGVILYYFTISLNLTHKNKIAVNASSFFFNAWYFNPLFNKWITSKVWDLSHHKFYKLIDRGLIENMIPYSSSKVVVSLTQTLSKMQSGSLYNYILATVLFFLLVVNITY
nr:NADH dehydrogenase subunit 5 [Morbakka sp. MKL-2023]